MCIGQIYDERRRRCRALALILQDVDLGNLTDFERAAIDEAALPLRDVAEDVPAIAS